MRRGFRTINITLTTNTAETTIAAVVTACRHLFSSRSKCEDKETGAGRVGGYFAVLTVSSFCLTLLCLMLIVVVSLPRLKCTDLAYEAGRLWLFLLMIWLLFVELVQLAFVAFWIYAAGVYEPILLWFRYQYQYQYCRD